MAQNGLPPTVVPDLLMWRQPAVPAVSAVSMAQNGLPPTVVPDLLMWRQPTPVPQLGNTLPLPPWPSFFQGSGPTASDSTFNLSFGFSQPLGGWPGTSIYKVTSFKMLPFYRNSYRSNAFWSTFAPCLWVGSTVCAWYEICVFTF
jgi:hypothetical protein